MEVIKKTLLTTKSSLCHSSDILMLRASCNGLVISSIPIILEWNGRLLKSEDFWRHSFPVRTSPLEFLIVFRNSIVEEAVTYEKQVLTLTARAESEFSNSAHDLTQVLL